MKQKAFETAVQCPKRKKIQGECRARLHVQGFVQSCLQLYLGYKPHQQNLFSAHAGQGFKSLRGKTLLCFSIHPLSVTVYPVHGYRGLKLFGANVKQAVGYNMDRSPSCPRANTEAKHHPYSQLWATLPISLKVLCLCLFTMITFLLLLLLAKNIMSPEVV